MELLLLDKADSCEWFDCTERSERLVRSRKLSARRFNDLWGCLVARRFKVASSSACRWRGRTRTAFSFVVVMVLLVGLPRCLRVLDSLLSAMRLSLGTNRVVSPSCSVAAARPSDVLYGSVYDEAVVVVGPRLM